MSLRLARILIAGFCVAMSAQQSNLGSLLVGDECRDSCPDDDASHRCPLNCMSCTCVGHGIPVSLSLGVPPTDRLGAGRVPSDEPRKQPDPQPDAIFHVPKSILV